MASALRLRPALKRGALVVAANWPLIVVQFVADSLYQLVLTVPVMGGAFMVAVLVGGDMSSLLSQGIRAGAGLVFDSLADAPIALASFVAALGLVAVAGAVVTFLAKAGTMFLLVGAERAAADVERSPLRFEVFRRANVSSAEAFVHGVRHLGTRYLRLGAALIGAYLAIAAIYIAIVVGTYRLSDRTAWSSAWPLIVLAATSAAAVAWTLVDLLYDLVHVIIAVDDCRVAQAFHRVWIFVVHDARQVSGIFSVVFTMVLLATTASLLATAGLGLVAWVPFVGLVVFPLQAAAWLVRGLLFEYVGLTAIAAYLTQYRRFVDGDASTAPSSRLLREA
jgi:hypothetical protein